MKTSIEYLQEELEGRIDELPQTVRAEAARSFLDAVELTRGLLGGAQHAAGRLAVVRATWLEYLSGLAASGDGELVELLQAAWDRALVLFGEAAIAAAKDALAEVLSG